MASRPKKSPARSSWRIRPIPTRIHVYALATHKLPTPGYKYTHILSDIQSLNEAALTETYDVTAVSFAAYPSLRDKYILLDCGGKFRRRLRPIVVSTKSIAASGPQRKACRVPGLKTSAYLSLRLYQPDFESRGDAVRLKSLQRSRTTWWKLAC